MCIIHQSLQPMTICYCKEINTYITNEYLCQLSLEDGASLMLVVESKFEQESYQHQYVAWNGKVEHGEKDGWMFFDDAEGWFDGLGV